MDISKVFPEERVIGLGTGRKEIIGKGGGGEDSRQRKQQHLSHLNNIIHVQYNHICIKINIKVRKKLNESKIKK